MWLDATLKPSWSAAERYSPASSSKRRWHGSRRSTRLNAVVTPIDPRPAEADGPFSGVPFLVKDLVLEVAGTRFTEGSRWLAGNDSTHHQELAVRYRRAGLVLIGKTNTCESGLSPTVEPALFGPAYAPSLQTVYRAATRLDPRLLVPPHRAPADPDGEIEPQTRAYWESSPRITATDYLLAIGSRQHITRRAAAWFESYDAWLTPTLGACPAPLGELAGTDHEPLRGSHNAGRYLMFHAWPTSPATRRCPCCSDSTRTGSPSASTSSAGSATKALALNLGIGRVRPPAVHFATATFCEGSGIPGYRAFGPF